MNPIAHGLLGGIVALTFGVAPSAAPAWSARAIEEASFETELPEPRPASIDPASVDPFPGRTYGNLDDDACLLTLGDRRIAYERYPRRARGVKTPVRLLGSLHGVRFMHADSPDWATSAQREVLDCRLVLSLDDLAAVVAKHGVTTVFHYGVYRGDLPLPKHGPPLHHVAALAIDVAAFSKDDGTRLDVKHDWAGYVGARTCEGSAKPKSERSAELREVLCDVAEEKLFHQVLTPNHNAQHKDHFHLEVMRGTSWTMLE